MTSPPKRLDRPAADPAVVVLAAVSGAHGIHGEVKLKVFADDLGSFRSFNGGVLTLMAVRPANHGAVARFAEVTTREAAEALRGTELTVPRASLPPLNEGEYYHADLLGLPVVTDAGDPVGRVVLVENFGAGDLVEIEKPDGKTVMVPMRPEAVPEWNDQRLVVTAAYLL